MNKEKKGDYLLFVEDLRPEELAGILHQLGHKAKGGKHEPPCDAVVVSALTGDHRRHVARLLGVSPDKLQPARRASAGEDVPMPPLTELKIIEAPAGARPKTEGPPRKTPLELDRLALVLAGDVPAPGAEARHFVQRRRPPRPGTLQVVLVLQDPRT